MSPVQREELDSGFLDKDKRISFSTIRLRFRDLLNIKN